MINSLQGLRVIGMLFVFLSHCGVLINTKYENIFYTFFYEGYFAVTFFFLLSGFVTYRSLIKKDIDISLKNSIKFTINKIKKFYLLHIIILICIFCINIQYGNNIKRIILSIPNILLLQSFIPIKSIYFGFNGVTWYLSSLVPCYMLSYLFIYLLKRMNIKKIIYYMIIIYIVQFSLVYFGRNLNNAHYIFYINPLWRSIDFLLGMMLSKILLATKDLLVFRKIKATYIEIMIVTFFMIMYFISRQVQDVFKYGVYYTPILICIIIVFYYQKGMLSKLLGCKFMMKFSLISFEFYMLHQVIMKIINKYFYNQAIMTILISFFVTILLSILFNKLLSNKYIYREYKIYLKNNQY